VRLNLFVRCFSLRSTKLEARNDIMSCYCKYVPIVVGTRLCVFFAEVRVACGANLIESICITRILTRVVCCLAHASLRPPFRRRDRTMVPCSFWHEGTRGHHRVVCRSTHVLQFTAFCAAPPFLLIFFYFLTISQNTLLPTRR
jgi:hypothetical protein